LAIEPLSDILLLSRPVQIKTKRNSFIAVTQIRQKVVITPTKQATERRRLDRTKSLNECYSTNYIVTTVHLFANQYY